MQDEIVDSGAGRDDVEQFLTFVLSGENYGINILNIREIVERGNVTKVPMMPDFIAGVINLRGNVVPVVDLAQRFAKSSSMINKKSSIVILEIDDEDQKLEIGVTVDEVNEVLDISAGEIEPTPSFGTRIRTDFISGMGKVGEQLLLLLDIENVLSVKELSFVEAMKD
ncbi:MAG: chemotaxis protein CheW [Chromatiales bacterium]|nr:chemotaxis protein CheW [Chromatiales bacterium]